MTTKRVLWPILLAGSVLLLTALACICSIEETGVEVEVGYPTPSDASMPEASLTSTPESTPLPPAPTPMPTGIVGKITLPSINGDYLSNNKVKSDADPPHEKHVDMPESMTLSVLTGTGSLTFTGEAPFVDAFGVLEEDDTFFATGRGTVAGFDNIVVAMDGSFLRTTEAVTFTAVYTMGHEGGLPSSVPFVLDIQGQKLEPILEESVPAGDVEPVGVFADSFEIAIQTGDTAFLYDRLHPVVPNLYGIEQCQGYLESVVDPQFAIDIIDVSDPGAWTWERDGHSFPITDTYTATANISAQDYFTVTIVHYAPDEAGRQQWFTDCGDPVP